MRGGGIIINHVLNNAGYVGYSRSSTVQSAAGARHLRFTSDDIILQSLHDRDYGYSLR